MRCSRPRAMRLRTALSLHPSSRSCGRDTTPYCLPASAASAASRRGSVDSVPHFVAIDGTPRGCTIGCYSGARFATGVLREGDDFMRLVADDVYLLRGFPKEAINVYL